MLTGHANTAHADMPFRFICIPEKGKPPGGPTICVFCGKAPGSTTLAARLPEGQRRPASECILGTSAAGTVLTDMQPVAQGGIYPRSCRSA